MGAATGQVLAYAVGISISPIPIIGVVLMLATPRGRINGPVFLLGWLIGVFVLSAVIVFAFGDSLSPHSGDGNSTTAWIYIVLGVLLLGVARRQFAGRPREGDEPKLPGWMASVDRFDPLRSFAMAIALSVLNPKNLLLIVGASAAIAQAAISDEDKLGALLIFTGIAMIGPTVPVVIYFGMKSRAEELLGSMKTWLARNNAVVMAVICVVIAAKLIGDGITALS